MRLVSREEIVENLETLHKTSKMIVELSGGHPPTFMLVRGPKIEAIDFTPYIEDKDLMEVMLKSYKAQDDIDVTILLTEAWALELDAKSELGKQIMAGEAEAPIPTDSPDRKEILFYLVETRSGKTYTAQADIIRNGDQTVLGPLQMMADEKAELRGRFVGSKLNS